MRADIARFFREYGRRKPGGANRSHDILRSMFDCAIAWDHRPEAAGNPCKGIVRYRRPPGEIRCLRWCEVNPERFTDRRDEQSLADVKTAASVRRRNIYSVLDSHLEGREFMVGEARTCADAFAYMMTRWLPYNEVSVDKFPNLKRHFGRFRDEPGMVRTEKEQGIRE